MRSPGTAPNDADHASPAELAAKVGTLPSAKRRSPGAISWRGRTLLFLAWPATLAVGLIALLRFTFHDGANLLIWLNAFTRYVYLPAYASLLIALWYRRRWLALINLLVIASHLYLVAPDFLPDRRFAAAPSATGKAVHPTKKLRIFFANVRFENPERGALLREIRDANPDIIVLVEFSFWLRGAMLHSPTMSDYQYGSGLSRDQATGYSINMFSKLPIKSDTREWIADRCVETVEIPIGDQTLQLIGIHAPRPMEYRDNDYHGFWRRALPLLLEKRGPTIIVGDFNATQYSRVYQQLKAGGFRSAHEDQGRGYATTWPNGFNWLPPIRIDQAFLSPEVSCTAIAEGQGTGSDHKPLILDVEIPQQP